MAFRSLADFLEQLGHAGELVRVDAEVDPIEEIAEITRRAARRGNPALLFGSVCGRDFPVVTNLLGSEGRIAQALAAPSLADVAARVAGWIEQDGARGWLGRVVGALGASAEAATPRKLHAGACQQVVRLGRDVDLDRLPMLTDAAGQPAPALTAAVALSIEPDTGRVVAGRLPLARVDSKRLAVGWTEFDELGSLHHLYRRRRQPMPLAVVLGGDPALLLAASAPLPAPSHVLRVAGLLRGKPVDVVPGRAVDIEAPADAEWVIEGFIDPDEPDVEVGPWPAPCGRLVGPWLAPAVNIVALTHRANPVVPAIVLGAPPHEMTAIDRAVQRAFAALVRQVVPGLTDYDLPDRGAARHVAVASFHKTVAGQAHVVMGALGAIRPFSTTKLLVLVDAEVDVRDARAVADALVAHVDPRADVTFQAAPADPWDPMAEPGRLGCRMLVDATRKLPGERGVAARSTLAGRLAEADPSVRRRIDERWLEYGLGPALSAAPR